MNSLMDGLRLLAVFAHPDDESFRPGGTLALLARRGVRVQVLTATRGEAGSRGNPPLCSPAELPAMREAELCCACTALRILPPRLLNYRDGELDKANPEGLAEQILEVVKEIRPQALLTFGADGLSGHPDHISIGLAAAEAFRRAEEVAALYTVAVPRSLAESLGMKQIHAVPDEAIALTVDVSSVWEAKMFAIRCHRTQLGESPILDAPEAKQRLFLGTEHFCLAASRPAPDGKNVNLQDWLANKTE
jgi:LmbE family N-acetylglucosaminyl deacetylase